MGPEPAVSDGESRQSNVETFRGSIVISEREIQSGPEFVVEEESTSILNPASSLGAGHDSESSDFLIDQYSMPEEGSRVDLLDLLPVVSQSIAVILEVSAVMIEIFDAQCEPTTTDESGSQGDTAWGDAPLADLRDELMEAAVTPNITEEHKETDPEEAAQEAVAGDALTQNDTTLEVLLPAQSNEDLACHDNLQMDAEEEFGTESTKHDKVTTPETVIQPATSEIGADSVREVDQAVESDGQPCEVSTEETNLETGREVVLGHESTRSDEIAAEEPQLQPTAFEVITDLTTPLISIGDAFVEAESAPSTTVQPAASEAMETAESEPS
jgi:hypothetical protein